MINLIKAIVGNLLADLKTNRFRAVFFLGFSNLLPDLHIFSAIRVIFWRAAGVKINIFGKSIIRKNVWIEHPENLIVGDKLYINRDSIISAQDKITIGENVRIGYGVQILTIYHKLNVDKKYIDLKKPILISDNCQIYSSSILLPGLTLGENSEILASSLVGGYFNPNSLIGGNPGRLIKKITT
jgi:acetyltransferase-like isoleucine patch superfamily enzyme